MSKKLLLADDSVTIQRVIELTFSGEDVQVVTADDGEEAIERIPQEKPDIILADIGMPKRSGYEVSAFVKGNPELEHIPVLLLAGAFEPVDETKAREVRCDGVLVKPFEPQQVVARVRELISGAKGTPTKAVPDIPAPAADDSLDEYFDKLDEAFATINTDTLPVIDTPLAGPMGGDDPFGAIDAMPAEDSTRVPTLDDLLAGTAPAPSPPSDPASGRSIIADAFSALLAAEQGEPGAAPPRLPGNGSAPVVTDAMIDDVARRVIEKLALGSSDQMQATVREIVSSVAERLVREEIDRIRRNAPRS